MPTVGSYGGVFVMSEVPLYTVSGRVAIDNSLDSTSFGACEVRCWHWLLGNEMRVSDSSLSFLREGTHCMISYRGTKAHNVYCRSVQGLPKFDNTHLTVQGYYAHKKTLSPETLQ